MWFIWVIGGIIIYVLLMRFAGTKLEDNEVNKYGGLRLMYSDYFADLKAAFPNLTINPSEGSTIRYQFMMPESAIQYELNSKYIKNYMFTTYKMYVSNAGELKLIYQSEKLSFENSSFNQFEMSHSIITRLMLDNNKWNDISNNQYPNRDRLL